jgi:hypothetical protein
VDIKHWDGNGHSSQSCHSTMSNDPDPGKTLSHPLSKIFSCSRIASRYKHRWRLLVSWPFHVLFITYYESQEFILREPAVILQFTLGAFDIFESPDRHLQSTTS